MKDERIDSAVAFSILQWDTNFFGVTCAKAILNKQLTRTEWNYLKDSFSEYQFISIENRNSEPVNAQLIGTDTTAFLADVNIQFRKKLGNVCDMPEMVQIYQNMDRDERILKLGKFTFSKFTEDPDLAKRGGAEVYRQWLINSFNRPDKFYAVAVGPDDEINGFLLHSYSERTCTVELIAVSGTTSNRGIGTSMFKTVEFAAYKRGCEEVRVGTQVRNIQAINFYHKCGCDQVECHQVYHLWNL